MPRFVTRPGVTLTSHSVPGLRAAPLNFPVLCWECHLPEFSLPASKGSKTPAIYSETLHQSLFTGTVGVPGLTWPSRSLFFFYNSGSFCLLSRPRFHWLTWFFLFNLWLRQSSCLSMISPRREMKQTPREYRKEKEALSLKLCFYVEHPDTIPVFYPWAWQKQVQQVTSSEEWNEVLAPDSFNLSKCAG